MTKERDEENTGKEVDELDNLLFARGRVDALLTDAHSADQTVIDAQHKLVKAFYVGGDELLKAVESCREASLWALVTADEKAFLKMNLDRLDSEISAMRRGRELSERIAKPFEKRIANEQRQYEINKR